MSCGICSKFQCKFLSFLIGFKFFPCSYYKAVNPCKYIQYSLCNRSATDLLPLAGISFISLIKGYYDNEPTFWQSVLVFRLLLPLPTHLARQRCQYEALKAASLPKNRFEPFAECAVAFCYQVL